jgi:hypothetical protein
MGSPMVTMAFSPFVEQFSTALNAKWDPAWNVAVTMAKGLVDSVLYGYAFNGHWYWYNGYDNGKYYFAIIIWKDYNCHGWQTVNTTLSGFSTSQKTQIETAVLAQSGKYGTNIWNIA